jgi:hypothetical protein
MARITVTMYNVTAWNTEKLSGSTSSASSAVVSAMRRAPHDGQKPRRLPLNAMSFSAWYSSQRLLDLDLLYQQDLAGPRTGVVARQRRADRRTVVAHAVHQEAGQMHNLACRP